MRIVGLLAALVLVCGSAGAQPVVVDGPIETNKTARDAFTRLGEQCPRLSSSRPDFTSIGLNLVAPGTQGVYSLLIQQFEAKTVLVVTLKINARAKLIPARMITKNRVATLVIIDTQRTSILVLDNPTALWLCDKSIFEGDRMALIPAPAMHEIFATAR